MMTKNHTTEYKKGLRARLKALKKNAGFTMVELIVCFAILGIFMVSAATHFLNCFYLSGCKSNCKFSAGG